MSHSCCHGLSQSATKNKRAWFHSHTRLFYHTVLCYYVGLIFVPDSHGTVRDSVQTETKGAYSAEWSVHAYTKSSILYGAAQLQDLQHASVSALQPSETVRSSTVRHKHLPWYQPNNEVFVEKLVCTLLNWCCISLLANCILECTSHCCTPRSVCLMYSCLDAPSDNHPCLLKEADDHTMVLLSLLLVTI